VGLIRLAAELSYESLAKNLSKQKTSLPDILKSKPESFHKTLFRPMVDHRLLTIIQYIRENRLDLYYCSGQRIALKPLDFEVEPAEVAFHFKKDTGGLSYFISISHSGEELNLRNKPGLVITEIPCILLSGTTIYSVNDMDGKRLRPFLQKERIDVPSHIEAQYFRTFIFQTTCRYPVIAEGFRVETVQPAIEPFIHLTVDWQGDAVAILSFTYGPHEVEAARDGLRLVTLHEEVFSPEYEVVVRDKAFERGISDFLGTIGLDHKSGSGYFLGESFRNAEAPVFGLISVLSEHEEALASKNIRIKQRLDKEYFIGKSGFETSMSEEGDWFDLRIVIRAGGIEFPFTDLRDSILSGNRAYLLPDGRIFVIPEEWMGRFHDVLALGKKGSGKLRLRKYHFALLQDVVMGTDSRTGALERLVGRLTDPDAEIEGFTADFLRPYQLSGVHWMVALAGEGFGGILADDMGLGKTLQTLALLDHFRVGGQTSLIVMPVSILYNWENEILKFAPRLRSYRLTGTDRISDPSHLSRFDVILTTYGIIRNDIDKLEEMDFRFVILDESQAIKNPDSETARAVKRLQAQNRMVLTGTPVENSITDLWSQMDFLNPGLLGSRDVFMKHYANQIDRGYDIGKTERIRHLVKPFILRRTKEAVAPELPPLTIELRYCDPSEEQSSLYETRKSEVRNYLLEQLAGEESSRDRMTILGFLLELRLISNHPVLRNPDYTGSSGKTTEILDMIIEIVSEGHKILIFSQFVMHLNLIGELLKESGISYVSLTGADRPAERKKAVDRFNNDPSMPLFLISLKAGGTGLNLTAADYVFILDPWWNPASELQAISRAHRIGQDRPVIAYKFITTGSIEEKVLTLQSRKQDLADRMINENLLDLADVGMLAELLA
jgi:superfamily II DNA or RNA helicase